MEFILGTVLAGIPLVVAAYDHYKDIYTGIQTIRHYSSELRKLDTILKAQKVLFQGFALKLLTTITQDQNRAEALLAGPQGDLSDLRLPQIRETRRRNLEEQFSSWLGLSQQLSNSLKTICLELDAVRQNAKDEGLRHLKKRFKLAWAKKDLQQAVMELRAYTHDLNMLTKNLVSELKDLLDTGRSQRLPAFPTSPDRGRRQLDLEHFRQIQRISARLHTTFALRWICDTHERHAASISLASQSLETSQSKPRKDLMRFNIAINPDGDATSPETKAIWLDVRTNGDNYQPRASDLSKATKHDQQSAIGGIISLDDSEARSGRNVVAEVEQHTWPIAVKDKSTKARQAERGFKSVRFATMIGEEITSRQKPMTVQTGQAINAQCDPGLDNVDDDLENQETVEGAIEESSRNLEQLHDFCKHFQSVDVSCGACVGYIYDLGLYQFYRAPERIAKHGHETLEDIICQTTKNELSNRLERKLIAGLATSLALAVLQYHPTPWLPQEWRSSQIAFFGVEQLSQLDAVGVAQLEPYLNVELRKPDRKGKGKLRPVKRKFPMSRLGDTASAQPSGTESPLSVAPIIDDATGREQGSSSVYAHRSELLFCYGIILLELAYSKPWPQLREIASIGQPPHLQNDFAAAKALSERLEMADLCGPLYTRAVQICLDCPAASNDRIDLREEGWEQEFLSSVVFVLQETMEALQDLETRWSKTRTI